MGAMILLHRWLGIAFCLLFAMWFASGIVMHFVPFPSLSETERFVGLAPIGNAGAAIGPWDAVEASGGGDAVRVRLIQRSDGPVYVVAGMSRLRAIGATDGTDAALSSPDVALAIATDHARRRGLDAARASVAEPAFLSPRDIIRLMERLATGCGGLPSLVHANDDYPASPALPGAPVYRARCGEIWFDIDGSNGTVLQRLDRSRQAYRWLYSALHTLDVPFLLAHSYVRSVLIVGLCALGFLFSLTGIVIGWRRLRHSFSA